MLHTSQKCTVSDRIFCANAHVGQYSDETHLIIKVITILHFTHVYTSLTSHMTTCTQYPIGNNMESTQFLYFLYTHALSLKLSVCCVMIGSLHVCTNLSNQSATYMHIHNNTKLYPELKSFGAGAWSLHIIIPVLSLKFSVCYVIYMVLDNCTNLSYQCAMFQQHNPVP